MPNSAFVALWSNDNQATLGWTQTITSRVQRLDGMLQIMQNWMTMHAAELTVSSEFKGVFLAPEYLFTKQSLGNVRDPMSETRRLRLEATLLGLSRKYPKILIVPGSIFYAKRLMRSRNKANKFDPGTGLRTLPKTSDRNRRDKAVQQVDRFIANLPAQRTPTDRDFHFWENTSYMAGSNAVPSLAEIRDAVRDPTKDPWIVKNAAYLLLGGRRIAKIDKQSDFGESVGASADDLSFIPGTFKQCPEVGGYRFGAEVCFDHGNAMLARRHVTPLHFHLVVSDWVHSSIGNMAMSNGGYFAHASTNYNESWICRRNDLGAVENITTNPAYYKRTGGAVGSMLDGYVVPLPAPLAPPLPPMNALPRL